LVEVITSWHLLISKEHVLELFARFRLKDSLAMNYVSFLSHVSAPIELAKLVLLKLSGGAFQELSRLFKLCLREMGSTEEVWDPQQLSFLNQHFALGLSETDLGEV